MLLHLDIHIKQRTIKNMLNLVAFEADAYNMSHKTEVQPLQIDFPIVLP